MFLRSFISPVATSLSTALLCDWLDWDREFFLKHYPFAGICVGAFAFVQAILWLAIIRWLSGGLYPLPGKEKP